MQALLQLPQPTSSTAASHQDLLLTALAVAGPSTAPALADGMLLLCKAQLSDSGAAHATAVTAAAAAAAWRTHPLSKALLSNAAAAQPLVMGAARLLTRSAATGGGTYNAASSLPSTLAALRPFLSYVLLDPQLAAAQPLLAPQLHGALARVACCCASPAAQAELLRLLAAHLPALRPSAGASQQEAAAAAVADVMDVVESCTQEPGGDGGRAGWQRLCSGLPHTPPHTSHRPPSLLRRRRYDGLPCRQSGVPLP